MTSKEMDSHLTYFRSCPKCGRIVQSYEPITWPITWCPSCRAEIEIPVEEPKASTVEVLKLQALIEEWELEVLQLSKLKVDEEGEDGRYWCIDTLKRAIRQLKATIDL